MVLPTLKGGKRVSPIVRGSKVVLQDDANPMPYTNPLQSPST